MEFLDMKKNATFLMSILFFLLFPVLTYAPPPISIRVSGTWLLRLDSADLTGGAGTGFTSTFESTTAEVSIIISKAAASWEVTVRRIDSNWDTNFTLYAQQTTGDPPITDGFPYQEVTTTSTYFFTGAINTTIDIQYKLEGVSVQTPVDDYVTTVEYTVTDI